jgi:glucoamylase
MERYLVKHTTSRYVSWRFNNKIRAMAAGLMLRVETLVPALVHWSVDGWRTIHDTDTRDTTLGVHLADLPTSALRVGDRVDFTFHWLEVNRWEGADFLVCVE